jgi:hypothetical protein
MINQEENPFIFQENLENIKNICLTILETILEYTSKLKKIPSIFDNQSNIKRKRKNIDEYNFEDLFKFCIKMLKINDNLLILIMMNIDKIISNGKIIVNYKNINRLFYTCLMITQKYYEDNSLNNKIYADLVGVNCDELLNMEMEYMNLIDFELFIKDDEFTKYKQKIIKFNL